MRRSRRRLGPLPRPAGRASSRARPRPRSLARPHRLGGMTAVRMRILRFFFLKNETNATVVSIAFRETQETMESNNAVMAGPRPGHPRGQTQVTQKISSDLLWHPHSLG